MKISVLVTMLLVVGIVLFAMFSMIDESEDRYGITINQSSWRNETSGKSNYDFAGDVNDSIQPIKSSIDDITNEDKGWLEKVGAGFTGIIAAVTFLPSMVWSIATLGSGLITGIGTSMGVPQYILLVFIIMLIVWGVFRLVEFLQRWQI